MVCSNMRGALMSCQNYEIAIFKEMRRRGYSLHPIIPAQYDACAAAIRTPKELVRDTAIMAESVVSTTLNPARRVPLPVLNTRKATCLTCTSFELLQGNVPVCHVCNCNGKLLEIKWLDADQECPKQPSLWPKYTRPT